MQDQWGITEMNLIQIIGTEENKDWAFEIIIQDDAVALPNEIYFVSDNTLYLLKEENIVYELKEVNNENKKS